MAAQCNLNKSNLQDADCEEDTIKQCERLGTCLSMLRKTATLGRDEEGSCFELGVALEKRQEWRLAWELFFALVQHLGADPKGALDMYAHAAVRCASLVGRVEGVVTLENIPVLCSHLRICFLQALRPQKVCQRYPSPRKLLEWLVHLTVPLNSAKCSELAIDCWRQVQQALQEGGDQALAVLMHQRSAEEQTQLLRLLGHHARTVLLAAAEVVADVLQRLLAPLTQADGKGPLRELLCKPNDAAVWLKAVATTLEALTLHLPYSSHQQSLQVLNWAEDFVADLSVSFPGVTNWQSLYALLSRGRLRAVEAFRRSNPELDVSRGEIFDAWKKPLFNQFESLARPESPRGADCEVCVPAKLLPLFQLSGLSRPSTAVLLEHLWHKSQGLEALRLQLPPGPVSALLALCQLQLHYQIFSQGAVTSVHSRSHAHSFGRLAISLATDPDFRRAIDSLETGETSGSSLLLRAVGVQLQRCLESPLEPRGQLGRLRFLQVQATVLQAQIDAAITKDSQHLMGLALDDWQQCLSLQASVERTPSSFMEGLQAAGFDGRCDARQLHRDLSDAAYLLEMLDLHAMCVRALAFCLACTVQQYGRNVLLWLQGAKETTLPKSICEVCLSLLYRLVAAGSRWERESSGQFKQVAVLEWWKFAEVKRLSLGEVAPMVLTQRTHALGSLSENMVLSEWRSGGCRLAAFPAQQGLQDALTSAEAFWSWSQWSGHWQETHCGQCPGGSATGAQTAALRSLKLLFHGPKVYSQGNIKAVVEAPVSELLRWPAWRSGLLQLRVIHQVSLLYDSLGEAELAVACADCGLELMQRKLCGDARWKLRFLCLRTRCAAFCFSEVTKEENALRQIEDLWNRRIQGQPPVELLKHEAGLEDMDGEPMSMPSELLNLWVKMSLNCPQRRGRLLRLLQGAAGHSWELPSERLVLLMQLQMDSDQWAAPVKRLLDIMAHHPTGAPFPRPWCHVLALLAQAIFNELKSRKQLACWMKATADLEHCCMVLSMPMEEIMKKLQVSPSLESFLQIAAAGLRGALLAGESAVARHCAQLLVGVADVVQTCSAGHVAEEQTKARSRSPMRERGDVAFARAHWKLCKQVVPLGGGVSLLFITELRAMQRRLEKMDHESAFECLGNASAVPMNGVVTVEDLCSGNWMSQLTADMSLAWLQVDWRNKCLQITRSVDMGKPGVRKVVSQRVPLKPQVLNTLQDELQQLHRANTEKIKELWQRKDKNSEASRLEFWRSRKGFDEQLGRLVQKIQKEVLHVGHFLLSPWPQSDAARQRVLDAVHSWLRNEATAMAEHLHLRGDEETEHFFLLALLLMEAEKLEVNDLLWILRQLWDGNRSTMRRLAYSMRRYSSELRQALKELPETFEVPLLLYVDGVMAQFPLEACPCLRQRNVVRGLAPSITLWAHAARARPWRTGFFVIDPAEDCAAMGDVRQLLASWSSHGQAWQGHTGKLPEPARVLEELCRKDVFVYLGHGERARELLRHEKLQIAGGEETDRERCGLRSILMLLGCSSVKIQRSSFEGDAESFGLASNALLGGAPLVLGAQWDVLGGDLDKLASRLLQRWLKEGTNCPPSGGLLRALKELRPKCLLPNLTGAALVCYGIPV